MPELKGNGRFYFEKQWMIYMQLMDGSKAQQTCNELYI